MGNQFGKNQAEYLSGISELLNLREIAPEQYKAAFDLIDKDSNGYIDSSEIKSVLKEVTQETLNPGLAKAFMSYFDTDQNDRVTWDEFKSGLDQLSRTLLQKAKVVFEGELVPVGASPDMRDKFLLRSGPEYQLHLVSEETAVEDNIHLSPNSKVNCKNDVVRIKALQRQKDGDCMAVFMNAKASNPATAQQWSLHIQQVIDNFRDAIENKTLSNATIVKEGWLIKYPHKAGQAKRRFFVIAKSMDETKVNSFLSFYYFVGSNKRVLRGMYPINENCHAKAKDAEPSKNGGSKFIWRSQHINPQGKFTESVQVELEALNRQQAHDWVELLTYLGSIPSKTSGAGTPTEDAAPAAAGGGKQSGTTAEEVVPKAPNPAVAGSAALAALEKLDAAQEEIQADKLRQEEMAVATSDLMRSSGIIPDVLPKDVTLTNGLYIKYETVTLTTTSYPKLDAGVTAVEPQVFLQNPETDALYCLIKTDPDAPSRENPIFGQFIHQVIVNIPSSGFTDDLLLTGKGQTVLPYVGCGAPYNSGFHRYIWLIYEQKTNVAVAEAADFFQGRGGKNSAEFAAKHSMKGPVAVACYEGQWDPSVDDLHKALGFMPPPVYRSPRQRKQDTTASASATVTATGTPFEQGVAAGKQVLPTADISADEAASAAIALASGNGYSSGLNYAPAAEGPTDVDSALNASIATAFAVGSGFSVGHNPLPAMEVSADEMASIARAYGVGHGYGSSRNAVVSDDDASTPAAFAYGLGYASGGQSTLPVIKTPADQIEAISQSYAAGERAFAELVRTSSTEVTPPEPAVEDSSEPTTVTPTTATPSGKSVQSSTEATPPKPAVQDSTAPTTTAPLTATPSGKSVQSKLAQLEADLAIEDPPKALLKRLVLIEETFYGDGHKGKGPVKARVEQLWSEMY